MLSESFRPELITAVEHDSTNRHASIRLCNTNESMCQVALHFSISGKCHKNRFLEGYQPPPAFFFFNVFYGVKTVTFHVVFNFQD